MKPDDETPAAGFFSRAPGLPREPVLLVRAHLMRLLWILPLTVLVAGAGIFLRMRRRNDNSRLLTTEPVSGQWLAEARGREEQQW